MGCQPRIVLLGAVLAFLLGSRAVDSRTWHITPDATGDAPTIQAGIDSAAAGDDVLLAVGTYTWTSQGTSGTSMIRLKPGVWLHSEGGAPETLLDAQEQGRVMLLQDAGNAVRIEGLTLQNGRSRPGFEFAGGAGILALGATEPTIVSSVIQNNIAFDPPNGGGVYCNVATITNCTFLDNGAYRGGGGGLLCGAATVSDCVFKRNGAGDGGAGGAIATSSATIENCFFEDNGVASGTLAPGGAIVAGGSVSINLCIFVNNVAFGLFGEGGAISFDEGPGVVRNSLFFRNAARGPGPNRGGAIGARRQAFPLIENCTILGSSGYHSEGIGGIWLEAGGTIRNVIIANTTEGQACGGSGTWICCNLFGNVLGDTICGTDGGGNFSADPQFCSGAPLTDLNVGLQVDSPCAPGNHPDGNACGLIGARPVACGTVSVESPTWSEVKSLYR